MKERIKQLRKAIGEKGITQQELADTLGLKRNTIATYEIGKTVPSDRVISDICNRYSVNEHWLRTGEGEMFLPMTRGETIAKFAGELMKDEDDSFRKRLVEALAMLNEEQWEVLESIAKTLTKEKD